MLAVVTKYITLKKLGYFNSHTLRKKSILVSNLTATADQMELVRKCWGKPIQV